MVYVLTVLSLSIQGIFLLKRGWLFDKRNEKPMLIAATVLFVVGLVLGFLKVGYRGEIYFFLVAPLISLSFFILFKNWYIERYGRIPEDTFWTMNTELASDATFNLLFWFFSIVGSFGVAGVLMKLDEIVRFFQDRF